MATTQPTRRILPVLCAACLLAALAATPVAAQATRGAGEEERVRPPLPDDVLLFEQPADAGAAEPRQPEAVSLGKDQAAAESAVGPLDGAVEQQEQPAALTPAVETNGNDRVIAAPNSDSAMATTPDSEAQALPARGGWMDPEQAAVEAQPLGAGQDGEPAAAPAGSVGLGGILRTLLALGLVVALVYACRGVIRRAARGSSSLSVLLSAGGRAPSGVLEVLGRYPISKQTTLVLLKIDRRVLLLSQTAQGFQTLAEITEPDEVASILLKTSGEQSERLSDRFASIFQQFERGGGVENTPMAPEVVDLTGARNPLASLRMRLAGMQERQA